MLMMEPAMHSTGASSFKMLVLALAALAVGATATASAASKKDRAARSASPTTCHGTPVIMQGLDCPQLPDRGGEQKQTSDRAKQPRITSPGSSTVYVAPVQRTPSLSPLPPVAPYVPPPVSNP